MTDSETFTTGSHAQTADGPVELGIVVSPGAMGVVVEAPLLGRLRAAFDVLGDGSARLSSLTRRGVDGVEVSIAGATEASRLARLRAELEDSESARAGWEERAETAGRSLHETTQREAAGARALATTRTALVDAETQLRQARAELSATQALLHEARSGQRHGRSDLTETRSALQLSESRLKRALADLETAEARHSASAAELADVSSRLALVEGQRTAADAERDELRAALGKSEIQRTEAQAELATLRPKSDAAQARLKQVEAVRDEAQRRLKLSETTRREQDEKLARLIPVEAEHAAAKERWWRRPSP